MEYHFDKKYIKCSIPTQESINNIPNNILIPFFIEYSALFPFIQFIFKKNENNEIDFIETNKYFHFPNEYILENEFYQSYTKFAFLHHHSIFYEIKTMMTHIYGLLLLMKYTILRKYIIYHFQIDSFNFS